VKGGVDHHGTRTPYPYVDYSYGRVRCNCADRVARLEHLVGLLAEALDVDLELLELLERPTVVNGVPASWDECLAVGLDPVSGEALT
jgi:hypothetical protein